MAELSIGDPVEVRMFSLADGEVWLPGTVVFCHRHSIGVAMAQGRRMVFEPHHVRPAGRAALAPAEPEPQP